MSILPERLTTIKVLAPYTTMGNPRRLFLVFDAGMLIAVHKDELGTVIPEKHDYAYAGFTLAITLTEYHSLISQGEALKDGK